MQNKKFYIVIVLVLTLSFTAKALASLTFTTDAITGTAPSTIDLGSENDLLLQTSGGKIGIGTATPYSTIDINGNLLIGNNAEDEFSYYNAPFDIPGGTGGRETKLQILNRSTRVDNHVHDWHFGFVNENLISPTGDISSTPDYYGIYSQTGFYSPFATHGTITDITSNAVVTGYSFWGDENGIANFGYTESYGQLTSVRARPQVIDAMVDQVRGVWIQPVVSHNDPLATSTVRSIMGLDVGVYNSSGGTVEEWYNIKATVGNSSGVIDKLYGLYLGPHTQGVTESYNIYSEGATSKNYFEGKVGIGAEGPSQKLEVNGGVRLNTVTVKPTCDVTVRGTFWATQGATDVKDDVEVCAKDGSNAYAWRPIY